MGTINLEPNYDAIRNYVRAALADPDPVMREWGRRMARELGREWVDPIPA